MEDKLGIRPMVRTQIKAVKEPVSVQVARLCREFDELLAKYPPSDEEAKINLLKTKGSHTDD